VKNENERLSRGELLQKLALAPLAIGAFAALQTEAEAAGTMDPKAAQYQTTPKGAAKCLNCSLYVPATTNPTKTNGACNIVKGSISPNGWCKFYAKKG
jgi:hypothetical protein